MKTFSSLMQNKVAFTFSIIVAVFLVVSLVSAATTISTNILTAGNIETTAGTLTVAGASSLAAVTTSGTLTVGSSGSALTTIIKGACTSWNGTGLNSMDGSQAASTTEAYDCAVTGAVSGDVVIAQLSTSTPITSTAGSAYWNIIGAKASTTAGYITVLLYNNGPTAVPSALGVGSSTSYIIIR